MLGFINRAFECFLRDTYGTQIWGQVVLQAGLGFDRFEPMQTYDAALTDRVIDAAVVVLKRPRDSILEDVGTYLVSHPNLERLRRLLRFGGIDFIDFLHSLEDLPERGRLALADLELPELCLIDQGAGVFRLQCRMKIVGIGHLVVGLLRAMADDYGALVLIDHDGYDAGSELVAVHLLDQQYSQGRAFDLAALMKGCWGFFPPFRPCPRQRCPALCPCIWVSTGRGAFGLWDHPYARCWDAPRPWDAACSMSWAFAALQALRRWKNCACLQGCNCT